MNQIECPCCGSKLKLTLEPVSALDLLGPKSRPAKSEYATVRDTPTRDKLNLAVKAPLVIPKVEPKKYRTNTDIGAFRQALADAGFTEQAADGLIFNDKNDRSRRLKLWFGGSVVNADEHQRQQLHDALLKYFGDRMIMCGSYTSNNGWRKHTSYIVRLKL